MILYNVLTITTYLIQQYYLKYAAELYFDTVVHFI